MIKQQWDMLLESIGMSVDNIRGNKLRSFLTTLGIIIGVAAIIALMTVVQGATDTMNAQFDAMGLGTLRVQITGTALKRGLTDADIQTLIDCEHVAGVSPSLSAKVTAKRGDVWSEKITVSGNDGAYFAHNPDLLERGRAINEIDVRENSRVCLLDGDAAKTLFFGEDPLGQTLYLNGREYTVVGMVDEEENVSLFSQILLGGTGDGMVYVPYTSAKKLLGTSTASTLEVYVTDPDETDAAVEEMEAVLDAIFNYKDDTYTIINMESMTEAMNLMTSMMMSLLVGIASIALLVGGIGIMNMMLVTVTERTTEIGLRKALGAEPGQIQIQFLIEAIILSLLGGVLGAALGLTIAIVICANTEITFALNTFAIVLGVGFSGAVGIIFGWAPARKASNLNPIDALRSM
ncbi:MAG: ABC transporter permease [Candidatus Ventricola sp.]|nr:ABC transporter permease [Candidatus Ventricola sp.]